MTARRDERARRQRLAGVALFLGAVVAAAGLFPSLGLTLNVTPSMPSGLYRMHPVGRPIARDDIVIVCAPAAAARLGRERGYLPHGDCAYDSAPLLKFVAAVGGDVVALRRDAIVVDGRRLRSGTTWAADYRGRPLPHIAPGTYRLHAGELWLWTPFPRSWDSRYFGPVASRDVRALATLLLPILDDGYVRRYGWKT